MVKQVDLLELLRKRGMDGDLDFLREALRVLVDGIMDAEVSAQIGAQHGERSPERVTYRNGYLALVEAASPATAPIASSFNPGSWPRQKSSSVSSLTVASGGRPHRERLRGGGDGGQ